MTYRIFGGIKYPVPGVNTAIEVLSPSTETFVLNNAVFEEWENDYGIDPPTMEQIDEELERENKIYAYFEYERDREKNYPDGADQLDMLFHDIKNGNIENGSWVQSIQKVKDQFPKPEEPMPDLSDYKNLK